MDILKKIDSMRNERGWSVNNLAMEAMLTQSTLNNLYKRGSEPKLSTLRAICNAFGVTLSEFFAEDADDMRERSARLDSALVAEIKSMTCEQKDALLKLLRSMSR